MPNAQVLADRSFDFQNRIVCTELFDEPPALSTDTILTTTPTTTTFLAERKANKYFELLGTNEVSADVSLCTSGGVNLSTHGGSADSAILLPHLTSGYSKWTTTLWSTAKSPTWELTMRAGSVITLAKYWLGFKLTNTPTLATDDDYVVFTYSSALGSGSWQMSYGIANTDFVYTVPTGIIPAVAASTIYNLRIEVASDRTFMGYINGKPIAQVPFPALTSLTTQIPYAGVISLTDAVVKTIELKRLECTRLH